MTELRKAALLALKCLESVAHGDYDGSAAEICLQLKVALEAEPSDELAKLRERCCALEAAAQMMGDYGRFLKDGETVEECIDRNRKDTQAVLGLLAKAKEQIAALKAEPVAATKTWYDPATCNVITEQILAKDFYKEAEPIQAKSITDAVMDVVDRLGSEWKDVDQRAWEHLRVYVPKLEAEPQEPVTAAMVRALRDKTNEPMSRCKDALVACKGNSAEAEKLLLNRSNIPIHTAIKEASK